MNPENREIGSWKAIINKIKEKFIKEDFLSLERTGDKALVVFVGEPFAYEAVWEESNGWCVYNTDNPLHKSVEPGLRILINVVKIEQDRAEYKLTKCLCFEMGTHVFRDLVKIRDKYGLENWIFELQRLDDDLAEPHFSILPECKIDDGLKIALETVQRLCLPDLVGVPAED